MVHPWTWQMTQEKHVLKQMLLWLTRGSVWDKKRRKLVDSNLLQVTRLIARWVTQVTSSQITFNKGLMGDGWLNLRLTETRKTFVWKFETVFYDCRLWDRKKHTNMRLLDSSHRIPRFLHWIKSVRNPHYFLRYHSLPQNWKINLFPSMHCRPIILENCHPSVCTVDLWYHCNIHHSIYLQ